MQRYVLHSHKLCSIKIIHNFYQNLSWVPCCIYFLGVNSGKSRSRQHALNGRLWSPPGIEPVTVGFPAGYLDRLAIDKTISRFFFSQDNGDLSGFLCSFGNQ